MTRRDTEILRLVQARNKELERQIKSAWELVSQWEHCYEELLRKTGHWPHKGAK